MKNQIYFKLVPAILLIVLLNNTTFSMYTHHPEYSQILPSIQTSTLSIQPLTSPTAPSLSTEVLHNPGYPTNYSSTIDQYQTYGNCWVGTNNQVLKIAQSFTPTTNYLDYIDLKLWINYTQPTTLITCGIYHSHNGQPASLVMNGLTPTYNSDEFYYSTTVPNPNNHNSCPWATFDFPDNPQTTPFTTYWLVIEVNIPLPDPKHVWLAGLYNTTDHYPNGTLAYHANTWQHLPQIDLMFITYGYDYLHHPPTADAGGPYHGYMQGGETIHFDASNSHDNDECGHKIIQYQWKFSEHDHWHTTTHPTIDHTYTAPDIYTITLQIFDNEGDTTATITTATIYPPGRPHISHIDSYYADGSTDSNNNGFFLQGLPLNNTYTAHVQGTNIDQVEFTFDGITTIDSTPHNGWTCTINTQNITNPTTTLTTRAHNTHGWGPTYTLTPKIIPVAGWLYQYLAYLENTKDTPFVTFEITTRDSNPLPKNNYWMLTANIDLSNGSPENTTASPVTANITVPVEDVGGDYSYEGGIGSSLSLISDGSIDISGTFYAAVTVKEITGSIAATLHGKLLLTNTIQWDYMYLTINGNITIPVFYLPYEIYGIGIEAGIDITPHVEITFNLEPTQNTHQGIIPGLGIKIQDTSGIIGNVGATICAHADIGFGIGDLHTEAGGDATLYFQTPSPPGYFKDFILNCWIGGRLHLLGWTHEAWWEYQWNYLQNTLHTPTYNTTPWHPLNRSYLTPSQGTYNSFTNTINTPFLENSYPYPQPTITPFPHTNGNQHLIIWTTDNHTQPPLKGIGLQYSIWDDTTGLTTPNNISTTLSDHKLQMHPQTTTDPTNNIICIFVQTPDTINTNTPLTTMLASTELAYTIYNTTTNTWTLPTPLTNNTHPDLCPTITTNNHNTLLLTWLTDHDANITTIYDRQLYGAQWNGTTWTPPTPLTTQLPIISSPSIKQHTTPNNDWEAYIALTLDQDTNLTTTTDQDIYLTYLNTTLTNTTSYYLTNNPTQQHTNPTLIYGTDTHPYCIWTAHTTPPTNTTHHVTLYYQQLTTTRTQPTIITTGPIGTPTAHTTNGYVFQDTTPNFIVSWTNTAQKNQLNCALINQNQTITQGTIYASPHQLTQTTMLPTPTGIHAITLERPPQKNTDHHCHLTCIHTNGYDTLPPQTTCTLHGTHLYNSIYGPVYHKNITITLNTTDQGLAGIDTLHYRLNNGAWTTYTHPITLNTPKAYVLHYYATDRAGNQEPHTIQQFQLITSQPPNKPLQPCGPTQGTPGTSYIYYTQATDPDQDPLYYKWKMGHTYTNWYGPYQPNTFCVLPYTWTQKGTYTIQVIAKDIHEKQSPWSDPLTITMPLLKGSTKIPQQNSIKNSCCTNQPYTTKIQKSYKVLQPLSAYIMGGPT